MGQLNRSDLEEQIITLKKDLLENSSKYQYNAGASIMITLLENILESYSNLIDDPSGAAGPAPLIPHLAADTSGYTVVNHDAYTDGVENSAWELTVDISGYAAETIHVFLDDPDFTGCLYNLTNIPLNQPVYIQQDDTPSGGGNFINYTFNGVATELAIPTDDAWAGLTAVAVIVDTLTVGNLPTNLHWTHYLDDFRPQVASQSTSPITEYDMGRKLNLAINGEFQIAGGQLQMNMIWKLMEKTFQ